MMVLINLICVAASMALAVIDLAEFIKKNPRFEQFIDCLYTANSRNIRISGRESTHFLQNPETSDIRILYFISEWCCKST